jgi:pyrroloquinoline quinone biosynthesis protein E
MDIAERPYALLAELTYRCPLHCPYCSNPVRIAARGELDTEQWTRVIQEAASLGVLHIGFSGGEPLQRTDVEALVRVARESELYTNLITSGLGLTESRARRLAETGLDNIQLSFQAAEGELADSIAGVRTAHDRKLRAAEIVHENGIALSLNVVLHRFNIDRLRQIIDFAEGLGATRLELANTQYYGWAFRNRSLLIPTRGQIEVATQVALAARRRLKGVMEVLYVLPDYFTGRPKPCIPTAQNGCRSHVVLVHREKLTSAVAAARRHSSPAILLRLIRHASFRPIIDSCARQSSAVRINSMFLICSIGRTPDIYFTWD